MSRTRIVAWMAVIFLIAGCYGLRATSEWRHIRNGKEGSFEGPAKIVEDPVFRGTLRVVFQVEGQRYVAYLSGTNARRVSKTLSGEWVTISGTRRRSDISGFYASRHIVGTIELQSVSEELNYGSPIVRSVNRIRRTLVRGARTMSLDKAALFTGLVMGDDRNQTLETISQFRQAGLSHLTAVSGQNVTYLLIAAAPLLKRLRPKLRLIVTVLLLGWFVLLTRAEPSVLRAVGMAGIGSFHFMRGSHRSAVRDLTSCVVILMLIDPLLGWSVGWWLSVCATAGLTLFAAPISQRIPGPRWLAEIGGASVAAQIATTPVVLLTFGKFPIFGLPANILAVPVAGLVMLIGLPLGFISGFIPDSLARILMFPVAMGLSWISFVAKLFAR